MVFTIKEKYRVNCDENLIEVLHDSGTAETIRIEPRFMEVLKILIESNGRVVLRETIIEKVWNNYGGGDEGLTQSISYLRKLLDDQNRNVIETISKKGYKLNSVSAKIDVEHVTLKTYVEPGNKLQVDKRLIWAGIAIICFLVLIIFYFAIPGSDVTPSPTPKALIPGEHQKKDSSSFTPKPDK